MYKDSVSRDQTCDFKHEYMLHTCNTATFFFCETLNSFFFAIITNFHYCLSHNQSQTLNWISLKYSKQKWLKHGPNNDFVSSMQTRLTLYLAKNATSENI